MSDEPSSSRPDARVDLARLITGEWVAGRLTAEQVLPSLAAVLGDPAARPTRRELLDAIEAEGTLGLGPLEGWLRSARAADARSAFDHRRRGELVPP